MEWLGVSRGATATPGRPERWGFGGHVWAPMEVRVKLPGARIVLECIKREGVDIIFGLPGGAVLPIYDALYDFEGLRHVLVRQEAAAGHAAEGYARATGKVGVCLVTSGPACTNLVTALQDAMMDSIPIVAFTGQVPTHLIGNDAFQEADNVGITRSATKHNFLVKDGKDLGAVVREAFHVAHTGRPGPVHVDLPKDILVKEAELIWPDKVTMRSYNPNYEGHAGQIKRAARSMVRAGKPVLYVGGGVISSNAHAELRELAELTEIPVTTTLMGLGTFPSEHPLSIEMLRMHGTSYANMAGQHQMWAAQYYKFKHPRAWFTSGGLGTMGYGLPTAMGVQAAHPNKQVINIDGDGSFQMNSQELATCFVEKLPVKTVIINNSGHGMVRQWQRIIYKERYCAIDLPGIPDWVKLAEAYGCVGLRVTKPSEVVPALEKMLSTPAPVVLDVCVDKDECVFPMVPAGGANTDMILAPPTREVRDRAEKSQTGF